ncbi:hypothetical protein PoB_006948800 [Plakobranchus ocellatus]|uniref:Uncharacterized protein n=1 Tax=Plakobranchus ocellatus TaxID=259542 RepID=A0AAV4DFY9_9GAST|nr:hypothetical protein PoB_006948800 [Plakobranchus ocellatus]
MYLRGGCLIVTLALASAGGPMEDTNGVITITTDFSESKPLTVVCNFHVSKSVIANLTKLKLFSSVDGTMYTPVGSITSKKLTYGLKRKMITLNGFFGPDSFLAVTWRSPDAGFCRYYRCSAKGREPSRGKLKKVFKSYKLDAKDGGGCQ